MKRKIILTALAVMLMSQNVFADNCDDLVTIWKSLYSNLQGKTYSEAATLTVTTPEAWENALVSAYTRLEDKITLNIVGFNEEEYDLDSLKNYNATISAKGFISSDGVSTIIYTFDYNPNFKIARAVETPALFDKLDLEQKEAYDILYSCTKELTENLVTDYEKELAIHNFITNNFQYGPLDMASVPQRAHSITGFIFDGQGICEAYANTFYVMCKMAGLDVSIITGNINSVSHMWNLIKLDGEYYHVDVTNDDPTPDVPNRERYTYFNLSDDLISQTHSWERSEFPACTSDKYNYYTLNNYIIHSEEELEDFINTQINSGNTFFTFRTEDYTIDEPATIRQYIAGKGFSSININGEYGKESTYNITLK